jgi:hypothetical protein
VLVGSSVASFLVRYSSDFTISEGVSWFIYTLFMAYLIALIKNLVNSYKELEECSCKEPIPEVKEIIEKETPEIKIL